MLEEKISLLKAETEEGKSKIKKSEKRGDAGISNLYYRQAQKLVELSELDSKNKQSYREEALGFYSKAIEKRVEGDKFYPAYLAGRSKLYASSGNNELAVKDVETLSKLEPEAGVIAIHVGNIVRDIVKLNAVQSTIKKLADKGTISPELEFLLREHVEVTAGLVVQVGAHGEKLDEHEAKLAGQDDRIARLEAMMSQLAERSVAEKQELEARLTKENLALRTELNEIVQTAREQGVKIEAIEQRIDRLVDKIDSIDYEQLEKIIDGSKLEEEEQLRLEEIEKSPYKASLYNSIRWQMNSLYLASTVITTDMVANQKSGDMGTAGGILKTLGEYTPLAGMALKLVGEILVGIDAAEQKGRLEIYSKLVADSREMSILSQKIAGKLAFELDEAKIITGKIGAAVQTARDLCENKVMQAGYNFLESDTATAAGSFYDMMKSGMKKVKEYRKTTENPKLTECVKRFVSDTYDADSDPVTKATAKGEADAKIIVKYVASQIFSGKIEASGTGAIANNIIKAVEHHYVIYKAAEEKAVTINMLYEIIYDNPVLNNGEELVEHYRKFGMQALDDWMELTGAAAELAQSANLGDC